jgi:type IV pilus assembly protein PilB
MKTSMLLNNKDTRLHEIPIGELLLREGLIDKAQLKNALQIQKNAKVYQPIGQILIHQKLITRKQLRFIISRYNKRLRIGVILVKMGMLNRDQLIYALKLQKELKLPLGKTLMKLNLITEETLKQALCKQLNIPFVDLDNITIGKDLAGIINKYYAQKHRIVPIARIGNVMTLAMDDPTDVYLIEEVRKSCKLYIKVVTATLSAIKNACARLYEADYHEPKAEDTSIELIEEDPLEQFEKSKYIESQESRNAITLLRKMMSFALNKNATDIHLEAQDRCMIVRFRLDGVLQEFHLGKIQEEINRNRREIIARVKILCNLDIAEKRRPQDGSFRAQMKKDGEKTNIDFRVSIIPGHYGENAVIRILDPKNAPKSIFELHFSKHITEKLNELLHRTSGIILVTGPTGSGKTTTLYGALSTISEPGIKILTAENPIEYIYDNMTQCEVNDRIGNTFANYLRSFLRHDPEVIMIGEIRDIETAEMAFRAAQTGHLILTTLHTNDALSTITRLLDLGIDRTQIATCLIGVLSQRLVRQVCPNCKEDYNPSEEIIKELFSGIPKHVRWQKGRGCTQCNFSGYKGRMAVAELWIPSEDDIIAINKAADFEELRASSARNTITMAESVMEKLHEGITNPEEVIRTFPYSSIRQFRIVQQEQLILSR